MVTSATWCHEFAAETIRLLEQQGRQNLALRELMRIEQDGREPGEALFTAGREVDDGAGTPWKNPEWIFVVAERGRNKESGMKKTLDRIRKKLETSGFANEAAVSQGGVLPILAGLGWEVQDTEEVAPEWTTAKGRVDYALCPERSRPGVLVEVKQAGMFDKGIEQLLQYAFTEGVPMAVLTDGRRWSVYLPSEPGSYTERRVDLLDVVERKSEEVERLLRPAPETDARDWVEYSWPGVAAQTLTHDLTAIRFVHRALGYPSPVGRGSPARELQRRLKDREHRADTDS